MRHIKFVLLLIIVLTSSCNSKKIKIGQDDFAVHNVNIVDVKTGDLWENMTLIIREDKIDTIGRSSDFDLSGSNNWVDGTGKYLIPGLWDMHAHLFNDANIRNVDYPLFIANGITGIRVMAADCLDPPCEDPNMTIAQHRRLQRDIQEEELLGPKSILASYYINGALTGESIVLQPRTEAHGRKLARLLKKRDVDFIKIYDELMPEAYYGITDEAKKLGLEFAGHVPITLTSSYVSEAGQKSIEHCCDLVQFLECSEIAEEMHKKVEQMFRSQQADFSYTQVEGINELTLEMVRAFDSLKCKSIYDIYVKNNTWVVPTLRLFEVYYPEAEDWKDAPYIKYMIKEEYDYFKDDYEPTMRRFWGPFYPEIEKKRREIIVDMHHAGVGILAGSDVGEVGLVPGFSLHEELVSLQKAGLSAHEVLQTATLNAAKYQNAMDSLGTIEKGKIADLILLNENPLEDIANTQKIEAVLTNGMYFNRKDLDSLLLGVETYIINQN
jgi:hypothetical protein